MRKSNYIVLAVLAVLAALLLALWYILGFSEIDSPLDLAVAIVWWVVIVAVAFAIAWFEERRRREIRTIYVSPTALFNCERGMVGLKDVDDVAAMQNILEGLEYGFDKKELPTQKKFDYRYVVQTDEFKAGEEEAYGLRKATSEDEGRAGVSSEHELAFDDEGAKAPGAESAPTEAGSSAKEPKWTGIVTKIDRENGNVETKFSCLSELRAALA